MTRMCFIVNPVAGHGRARANWERTQPLVERLSQSHGEYRVCFTEFPGHATTLARQAAEDGYDRVAVFGGDGTLNETGNGLVGTGAALAIVATGSANDWVRQFPIPTDIEAAVRLAYEGRRVRVDAGVVEYGTLDHEPRRRYFFNMIGAGFDAEAAERVNRFGGVLKVMPGTLPSLICVILTLFTYRFPTMTLRLDGREVTIPRGVLSIFGLCGYIGGGMWVLPAASPYDGLIDVMWAHGLSRPAILYLMTKIYKGKHIEHPKVELTRAARVEVTSDPPLIWHVDGEILGRLPITVQVVPKALDVVMPHEGDRLTRTAG